MAIKSFEVECLYPLPLRGTAARTQPLRFAREVCALLGNQRFSAKPAHHTIELRHLDAFHARLSS